MRILISVLLCGSIYINGQTNSTPYKRTSLIKIHSNDDIDLEINCDIINFINKNLYNKFDNSYDKIKLIDSIYKYFKKGDLIKLNIILILQIIINLYYNICTVIIIYD